MQMWFFMLFIVIVLPLIMFMSSFYFIAGGPKNINNIFGYRTGRSMINKDTWIFAHEYCGKLWLKVSIAFILASIVIMLCLIKTDQRVFVAVGFVIFIAEFVTLFFTINKTEKALADNFDIKGNRKK
jgi:uncharacterized membrane protein